MKPRPSQGVMAHAVEDAVDRQMPGDVPLAAHRAEHVAAKRAADLAMPRPGEGIELHDHEDRAREAGREDPRRDFARGVLRHEIERDRIDEERLEGDVQIAEQRHQLIDGRLALAEHRIADGLQRLHAGEIKKAHPERHRLGITLQRRIRGPADAHRRQYGRRLSTPAHAPVRFVLRLSVPDTRLSAGVKARQPAAR